MVRGPDVAGSPLNTSSPTGELHNFEIDHD